MAENSPNSEIESSLSPGDFLNVSGTTDAFLKMLDNLKEVVECKADIVIKRKEKHQQVLDKQIEKLKKEKEQYLNQAQYLAKEIPEVKTELAEVEHSIDVAQTENTIQLKLNKEIEDKVKLYEAIIEKRDIQLSRLKVSLSLHISYYNTYMGVSVDYERDSKEIVIVVFENIKRNLSIEPFLKFEIISKKEFNFLDCNPKSNEFEEYMGHSLEHYEVVSILHKFRKHIIG